MKAQAASLLGVYTTELWLAYGSCGSLEGAVVGRGAAVWAELASETAEAAAMSLSERKQGENSTVCCKNVRLTFRTQEEGICFAASQ